jgi:hypothetical protein
MSMSASPNPLVRLFPVTRATIHVPLAPDDARSRLFAPAETEWQLGEGGIFGNRRRYKVGAGRDGYSLDIDGPYGNKKTRLYTYVRQLEVGTGTNLELASRISDLHAVSMVIPVLWLAIGSQLMAPGFAPIFLFVPLMAAFFYGATLINLNYEAGVIRDYFARRLSDERNRVLL